jgi:DNA-binding beta-propeller fold protein YncE
VTSEVVNKKRVDFGQDLDLDGKNETADVLSQVTVEAFEDVTVPEGAFANTARVVNKTTLTVFSSAGAGSVTVVTNQTIWFAPGVGPVKRNIVLQADGGLTESSIEDLVDVSTSTARQVALATNDMIYDPKTQRVYASIPGNPGSIRSIDPTTGDVGTPIPVGSEPMKLALSDNGQYLYVGLDGEAAVQRVDLTTQKAGPKFKVLPGSPWVG